MPSQIRIYRRFMPHWRIDGAIYFVTWRLEQDQPALTTIERERLACVLRHFDHTRYELFAYVVVDDHVHVLVKPNDGYSLERILQSWKSYSGRNMHDGQRRAPVWQRKYYDRIVRNDAELRAWLEYIVGNPERRWPGV